MHNVTAIEGVSPVEQPNHAKIVTAIEAVSPVEQPNHAKIAAFLEMMHKKHNAQCRKPGFKGHFHQPAGSSLGRHLNKNGSVYGPVSIVSQGFAEIRKQAWDNAGKAATYLDIGKTKAAEKAVRKMQKV